MKIKKITLEQVYNFLKKYNRLILAAIFLLLLVFNVFIAYKYVYLTTTIEKKIEVKEDKIDEITLNKVLDNISQREENLKRVYSRQHTNPF